MCAREIKPKTGFLRAQVLGSLNLSSIRGFLMSLYQRAGIGNKPFPPVSISKATSAEVSMACSKRPQTLVAAKTK